MRSRDSTGVAGGIGVDWVLHCNNHSIQKVLIYNYQLSTRDHNQNSLI